MREKGAEGSWDGCQMLVMIRHVLPKAEAAIVTFIRRASELVAWWRVWQREFGSKFAAGTCRPPSPRGLLPPASHSFTGGDRTSSSARTGTWCLGLGDTVLGSGSCCRGHVWPSIINSHKAASRHWTCGAVTQKGGTYTFVVRGRHVRTVSASMGWHPGAAAAWTRL